MSFLSKFPAYALVHPTHIDLKEYPACFLSGRPFPTRLGFYNQAGHPDIWELIVPLSITEDVLKMDDHFQIFVSGPFIRFFFYCDAIQPDIKEETERLFKTWLDVAGHSYQKKVN